MARKREREREREIEMKSHSRCILTKGPLPPHCRFRLLVKEAFEVQVGLHELLGHGSGKMFRKDAEGTANWDEGTVTNPLTTGGVGGGGEGGGGPTEGGASLGGGGEGAITSWYLPGETWDSKFPGFGSSYEECRAECVGIYLCLEKAALDIFGHTEAEEAAAIKRVNWLNMVRAGLLALTYYSPDAKKWGQAHMQARYVNPS